MSFISPIFLLGLLGISLPIIIHMVGRRHAPTYKFSAIEFILRSKKKVEAQLKLEQMLLLLLRAAVIALIAMALAKPILKAGATFAPEAPSCNVLIIDNSYSMGYLVGGKTLLEKAKEWARQLVGSLSSSDETCVITIFPTPESLPQPTPDKSGTFDSIDRIAPSYYTTNISPLLEKAFAILSSSKKQIQRIFLFTDLARNGWKPSTIQEIKKRLKGSPVRLHVVDTSEGKSLSNISVSWLEHEYDWTKKDEQVLLRATVSNFTNAPVKDLLVKARIGGKDIAQGFLQLEPWGSSTKEFLLDVPKDGNTWGSIEIPTDSLPVDDKRYFTLPDVRDIRVLVIDGAPSINMYQSETFYLERALNPARFHTSHIKPTVMNPQEVLTAEFKDYDLVILANVEKLDNKKLSELKEYTSEGGNVFFCLGDKVRPDYYNPTLTGLVPRLHMAVEFPKERPLELGPLDTTRTVLKVFTNERKDVLSSPHFYKVFLVEPEMGGDVTNIISYSNGAPALLEMPYGKGRSMTFTSTIDRDWTNLPVKPIFLPLVQQICRYMTGNLIETTTRDILVGEDWELPFYTRDKADAVEILDPKGNLGRPISKQTTLGRSLVFSETHFPGVYKLRTVDTPISFAVNLDPKEGNMSKIDKRELEEALGREKVSFRMSSPIKGAEGVIEGERLWSRLLIAALCLLCLEAFVSWRQS
ncbi:MAG: BatA domain-containing protein [Candidatus Brocadiales bacterium]